MAEQRDNPYSNFNFVVFVGNEQLGAFSEVSGLDSENTPIEYREGADAVNTMRKYAGIEKYSNVSLKRGITGSLALWNWRKEVRDSTSTVPIKRDVTIKLLNEQGNLNAPAMTFTLRNAWPTKITGPSLNAKGNDIAIEQLDLVHERLDIT
ncbi:MAG: phage tail protein [Kofleriaceae bacterium]